MNQPIIRTDRLFLSEFALEEAAFFYNLNANTNVLRYTGDLAFGTIDEAEKFISKYSHYSIHGFGRWSVYRVKDEQWLGWCGLKRNSNGIVDIGFRFLEEEWNRGYATESARAVLQYGFDKLALEEIIARCSVKNLASIKVIKKLEMNHFKTEQNDFLGLTHYYIKTKN